MSRNSSLSRAESFTFPTNAEDIQPSSGIQSQKLFQSKLNRYSSSKSAQKNFSSHLESQERNNQQHFVVNFRKRTLVGVVGALLGVWMILRGTVDTLSLHDDHTLIAELDQKNADLIFHNHPDLSAVWKQLHDNTNTISESETGSSRRGIPEYNAESLPGADESGEEPSTLENQTMEIEGTDVLKRDARQQHPMLKSGTKAGQKSTNQRSRGSGSRSSRGHASNNDVDDIPEVSTEFRVFGEDEDEQEQPAEQTRHQDQGGAASDPNASGRGADEGSGNSGQGIGSGGGGTGNRNSGTGPGGGSMVAAGSKTGSVLAGVAGKDLTMAQYLFLKMKKSFGGKEQENTFLGFLMDQLENFIYGVDAMRPRLARMGRWVGARLPGDVRVLLGMPREPDPFELEDEEDEDEDEEDEVAQSSIEERRRRGKLMSDGTEKEWDEKGLDDPEVVKLLEDRQQALTQNKKRGKKLRITWPPKNSSSESPIVHLQLHYQQFREDGAIASKHNRATTHVQYVAESKATGQPVLTRYYFHTGIVPHIPKTDAAWHFPRCSIVSNSGEMLKTMQGEEIDLADAVFRINYPPLAGFERFVGRKTTFEVTNHHHAQLIADQDHPLVGRYAKSFRESKAGAHDGQATLVLIESTNSLGWKYNMIDHLLHRFPSPHTILLSPDFVVASEEVWKNVSQEAAREEEEEREAAEQRAKDEADMAAVGSQHAGGNTKGKASGAAGRGSSRGSRSNKQAGETCRAMARRTGTRGLCKPTSGWFALMFASQICDQVHMFGFSAWRKHSTVEQAKYHYFDNVTGVTNVHSFDLQLRVYHKLAERYPIIIH